VAGAGKFAISEVVRKVVPEWPIGETIACPVCGRPGKASITTAKGAREKYVYRVVYHSATERCVVKGAVAKITESGEVVRVEGGRGRRVQRGAGKAAAPVTAFAEEVPAQVQAQAQTQPQVQAPKAPAEVPAVEERAGAIVVPEFRKYENVPEWRRKAWHHIGKAWASWGSFRENPTEENFKYFINTVQKVAQRVGVPCHYVIAVAEHFYKEKSGVARGAVNNAMQWFTETVFEAFRAEGEREGAAQRAPQPAFDFGKVREVIKEEVSRAVEEAVKRIEEAAKVPVVTVGKEDYAAMFAVFRTKKGVPEEVRKRAYAKWEEIFAPGRKVVVVEG